MLVLSRRVGESLILDDGFMQVRVVVTKIDKTQVKIGIEAPREVNVARSEVIGRRHDASK